MHANPVQQTTHQPHDETCRCLGNQPHDVEEYRDRKQTHQQKYLPGTEEGLPTGLDERIAYGALHRFRKASDLGVHHQLLAPLATRRELDPQQVGQRRRLSRPGEWFDQGFHGRWIARAPSGAKRGFHLRHFALLLGRQRRALDHRHLVKRSLAHRIP